MFGATMPLTHSELVAKVHLIRQVRDSNTTPDTLEQIAIQHIDDNAVAIALLQRIDCPLMVFSMLGQTTDVSLRYSLANHPRCPSEVLRTVASLSSCNDPLTISTMVMEHPNTPADVWAECRLCDFGRHKLRVRFLP